MPVGRRARSGGRWRLNRSHGSLGSGVVDDRDDAVCGESMERLRPHEVRFRTGTPCYWCPLRVNEPTRRQLGNLSGGPYTQRLIRACANRHLSSGSSPSTRPGDSLARRPPADARSDDRTASSEAVPDSRGILAAFVVLMYTAGQATFERRPVLTLGDSAAFGPVSVRSVCDGPADAGGSCGPLVQLQQRLAGEGPPHARAAADDRFDEFRAGRGKAGSQLAHGGDADRRVAAVFALLAILGGISTAQVFWAEAVCLATAALVGSWSTMVAYWRDKTFQTLAICVIGALLYVVIIEGISAAVPGLAGLAATLNPYRAMAAVLDPLGEPARRDQPDADSSVAGAGEFFARHRAGIATMLMVRIWNPSRFAFDQIAEPNAEEKAAALASELAPATHSREQPRDLEPADPVERGLYPGLWPQDDLREAGLLRLAGFIVFNLSQSYDSRRSSWGCSLHSVRILGPQSGEPDSVNAQAVTSLTSERDAQTLELLLVTNVTAKEFVFGKWAECCSTPRK